MNKNFSILIVDDEDGIADSTAIFFEMKGAEDLIIKPFNLDNLYKLVVSIIEKN